MTSDLDCNVKGDHSNYVLFLCFIRFSSFQFSRLLSTSHILQGERKLQEFGTAAEDTATNMIINIQELNVFQGNVDVYKTSNSGDIQKVDAVAASTMDSLPLNDEHVVSEFAGNSKAGKYVNDGAKSAKAGAKASKASETTSTSSTTTTYDCGGSCLCVAGDLRVSLLSDPEP